MCGSRVDIQTRRLRIDDEKRYKKERKKKAQDKNIMACPIP